MKQITIKDIAKMLQISTSTVSRALKDHPDISESVKDRVREVAKTFNYVPNNFAINFRKSSSKVIGLILPEISMFFVPSIIKGISEVLHSEGFQFFVLSSQESVEMEEENIQTCINTRVDGVLISLTKETQSIRHLENLKELELPLIIFDKTIPQDRFDEVVFDNSANVQAAAEKLIKHQCKKILAVFGSENLAISQLRKKVFLETLSNYPEVQVKTVHGDPADSVKEKLEILLEYEEFDGFFAMSDETLAGLHGALMKHPEKAKSAKIIAISEGLLPKYLNESYEIQLNDGAKMGRIAAKQLLAQINGVEKRTSKASIYV